MVNRTGLAQRIVSMTIFVIIMLNALFIYANAEDNLDIYMNIPQITIDNGEYVFDISVNGIKESGIYGDVVVATYDSNGDMLAAGKERLTSLGLSTVYVPVNGLEASYKIFALDRFTELKPLCKSFDAALNYSDFAKVTLNSDNLANLGESTKDVKYYKDSYNHSPVNTDEISVSKNAVLTFNGFETDYLADADFTMSELKDILVETLGSSTNLDMDIVFEDTDYDGYYDVINADYYVYGYVDSVSYDADMLQINGMTVELNFDDNDITTILTDSTGNALSIDDFDAGDSVAVMSDNFTSYKNYNDYIKVVKLTDNTITGTVCETYTAYDVDYCVINGDTYAATVELNVGDNGVFYLTPSGKIFSFYAEDKRPRGYILEAALVEEAFSNTTLEVKILNSHNRVEVYMATETCGEELASYLGLNSTKTKLEHTPGNVNMNRFIAYEVNSKNNLRAFEAIADELIPCTGEYKAETEQIGNDVLGSDMSVYCLDAQTAADTKVIALSDLTSGNRYTGSIVADASGEYAAYILTDGAYSYSHIPEVTDTEGYILKAELIETSLSDDFWQVYYLTAEAELELRNTTTDYAAGFASYLGIEDNAASYSYDNANIAEQNMAKLTLTDNRITAVNKIDGELIECKGKFDADSFTLENVTMNDATKVYDLRKTDYTKTFASNAGYLVDNADYTGYALVDENNNCKAYVISDVVYNNSDDNNLAIVTKVAYGTVENLLPSVSTYAFSGGSSGSSGSGSSGSTGSVSGSVPSGSMTVPNGVNITEATSVTKVSYIQDEVEKTAIFFGNTEVISESTSVGLLKVGDLLTLITDLNGVAHKCAVLGTVIPGDILTLDDEGMTASGYSDNTELLYGYIANENHQSMSKGEILHVNVNGEVIQYLVDNNANKYTYNDSGRIVYIDTEDFMSGDVYYFDSETNESSMVFMKITDEDVTDIYSFNQRINIDNIK